MRDTTRFLLYSLIFGFFLSFVAAWVYPKQGLSFVLTALLAGAIVLFLLLYNNQPLKTERDRERVLLTRVQDSWAESLTDLERLAPGASLLDLSYQSSDRNSAGNRTLSITRAFEEAGRSLMILGPEASGKTVSALILIRHLVKRALQRQSDPMPVFLSLSSWNDRSYNNFEAWLVAELKLKYDVAESVARNWLIGRRLLLVLDGLDEVVERHACVRELELFVDDLKPPGIVVSSRDDGKPLPKLKGSIEIGKLSERQIKSYSQNVLALGHDGNIAELASSPLGLTLMLIVGEKNLPPDSTREDLLKAFIESQISKTERVQLPYQPEQITRSLQWLARGMAKHRQAIFYIEGLQPSWLPNQLVYTIASRIVATFSVMMLGYITMLTTSRGIGYFLRVKKLSFGVNFVTETPWEWLFITIVIGGLFMAAIDYRRFRKSENLDTKVRGTLSERGDFRNLLFNVLGCWPVFFGFGWLMFDLVTALSGATVYAISFGLVFWFRGKSRSAYSDIRTADKVTLTSAWLKGILPGAAAGGILGLGPALIVGYKVNGLVTFQDRASAGIKIWLVSLLIGVIVGAVTRGLDKVSVIEKTYPNQGVWLSLRNTVLIWLVVGFLTSGALWGYAILRIGEPSATLQDSLFIGSVIGMLVGFGYGGLDVVYHIALRFLLYAKRFAPFVQYSRFLNDVTHLGFLRKVGGGYMFLHGSLRKQFEDWKDPTAKP